MKYVMQTGSGTAKYTDLFRFVAHGATFDRFYAAVAYATTGGVRTLQKILTDALPSRWDGISKKWLVGIDWCRSDPPALARLQQLPNSAVRIPNGRTLLRRLGCALAETYHPKLFIFSGHDSVAVVCGSGNLSANGLTRGCECGSAVVLPTAASSEAPNLNGMHTLTRWFQSAWNAADRYAAISRQYEDLCRRAARRQGLMPTEDDVTPPRPGNTARQGLSADQIRQLRTFDNFWIEAGALGANLGPGVPGNQLDMKRFTRAFFDVPVENVVPNTIIDRVTLVWDGTRHADRTLKFGDNGMDKLNVPPAANRGAAFYRGKTLLFTRQPDGSFLFNVGDAEEKNRWRSRSRGLVYRVGRREWGLF